MTEFPDPEDLLRAANPRPSSSVDLDVVDRMVDGIVRGEAQVDPRAHRPMRHSRRLVMACGVLVVVIAASLVAGLLLVAQPSRRTYTLLSWETVATLDSAWQTSPSQTLRHGGGFLTCPTSKMCVAEVPPFADVGHPTRLRLEITNDAGTTWVRARLPQGVTQAVDRFGVIDAVSCTSSAACFVLGQRAGALVLLSSVTDGATWTTFPGPSVPAHFAIEAISCASASHCVIAGGLQPRDAEPIPTYAEITSDAGQHWLQAPLPRGFAPNALRCFRDGTCVSVGVQARKYQLDATYSEDGGRSWHQATLPPLSAQVSRRQFDCGSPDRCLLTTSTSDGRFTQLASVDRGRTWAARAPVGIPHVPLEGMMVSCGSGSSCWGQIEPIPIPVLPRGSRPKPLSTYVYETTNFGARWKPGRLPTHIEFLTDIECPSSTACFALAIADGGGQVFLAAHS